ncbi:unnamed protein product, partial [Choristocarpus tenellus]
FLQGPESLIRPLKDRLRFLCKQRRIRLQDFFGSFDLHHNKKVTKAQFKRAMDLAGLTTLALGIHPSPLLTPKEIAMLEMRYRVEENTDLVNYGKLCEQIEKIFTHRGLEMKPTKDLKLSLEGRAESAYGRQRPGLSPLEVNVVDCTLQELRKLSRTQGLIIKDLFSGFDRHNNGRVTSTQFLRQVDLIFKGRISKEKAK